MIKTEWTEPVSVLVVLPGLDGTGLLLEEFVSFLDPEVEPLVVSYPARSPLDYPELEAFVRERLPSNCPFVLLGESFSGPVAISIAASRPPDLRGLILCCSFARAPRRVPRWVRSLVVAPPTQITKLLVNWLVLGRHASKAWQEKIASIIELVSPDVFQTRLHAAMSVDVTPKFAAVEVPTLYLRASGDRLIPASAVKAIRQVLPTIIVDTLDGPHGLLQSAPREAARVVNAFVRRVAG